jgi:secreted trypsin-like serine protease
MEYSLSEVAVLRLLLLGLFAAAIVTACEKPVVENGVVFQYQNKFYLDCNNGFMKAPDQNSYTCADARAGIMKCKREECLPKPPELEHGHFIKVDQSGDEVQITDDLHFEPGSKARYRCNDRFEMKKKKNGKNEGRVVYKCEENRQWKFDFDLPICIATKCPEAPQVKFASFSPAGPQPNGATVTYKCDTGELIGDDVLTCSENADGALLWDKQPPSCKQTLNCEYPELSDHLKISIPEENVLRFTCDYGYNLDMSTDEDYDDVYEDLEKENGFNVDEILLTPAYYDWRCVKGNWHEHALTPVCNQFTCEELPLLSGTNSNQTSGRQPVGTLIEYWCDEDYVLSGDRLLFCEMDKGWSNTQPICTLKHCPGPVLENGRVHHIVHMNTTSDRDWYRENDVARFECYLGYELHGPENNTCDGWGWTSNAITTCQPFNKDGLVCLDPGIPAGGIRREYRPGKYARYDCQDSLKMDGPNNITCSPASRLWSADPPSCRSEYHFPPVAELAKRIHSMMESYGVMKDEQSAERSFYDNVTPNDPLILYFVVDVSGSILEADLNKTLSFIKALIGNLKFQTLTAIGKDKANPVRVGIVKFSDAANMLMTPWERHSDTVDGIVHILDTAALGDTKNATNLNGALNEVLTNWRTAKERAREFLDSEQEKHGWDYCLKNAKKTIVILSDGKYNMGGDPTKISEQLKDDEGFKICTIGVTDTTNSEVLENLASEKSDVYYVKDHDSIEQLVNTTLNYDINYDPCGFSFAEPCGEAAAHIRGGDEADRKEHPWVVQVFDYSKKESPSSGLPTPKEMTDKLRGGGSLISNRWVLTAGHVIKKRNNQNGEVPPFKKEDLLVGIGNFTYEVEKVILHENFSRTAKHRPVNDIALLKLKESKLKLSMFVKTVCLPKKLDSWAEDLKKFQTMNPEWTGKDLYKENSEAYIAGWGTRVENENEEGAKHHFEDLHKACVPLHNCPRDNYPNVFCAGDEATDAGTNDSGGPMYRAVKDKDDGQTRYVQIGIVSFNDNKNATLNKGNGAYVKVDDFVDWINNQVK